MPPLDVPIAGGECLTAAYEWRVFAEQDCFDIGQPDASFTGGLGEFLKVADMLERSRPAKSRPTPGARADRFMQNVHAGFAAGNTRILEIAAGLCRVAFGRYRRRTWSCTDGYVLPPDRPGLGIVLTDEIRRYPFKPGSGEFNSVPGKMLRE